MTRVQTSQRVRSSSFSSIRVSCVYMSCFLVLFAREQLSIALGTEFVLTSQIAVCRTDRKGRCNRDIRQAEVAQCALHQTLTGLSAGDLLRQVQVQHGATGILTLQVILALQRLERIVGEADR